MAKVMNVGVVGCGNISPAYFNGAKNYDVVKIVACADMNAEKAKARGEEFGVRACSVSELLADASIDIVLNLTIPKVHAEVNAAALNAGKHAYCEKPFAVTMDEAAKVLALAESKKLRVGCAPDTFLGGGIQTCRKLIDDGAIGVPVAATAFMTCGGHESWHPDPEFYYQVGGGPMLDMGPYYVTALVNLLGPIRRVAGFARPSFATRTITSQPKNGKVINVDVPTHYAGSMEFAAGMLGTIVMSFDVKAANLPIIEIYGSQGTLSVPDPNCFGGAVRLFREGKWQDIPLTHTDAIGRGTGVADMAFAIQANKPHRASGQLAAHVLETMLSFETASKQGRQVDIATTCTQPSAVPAYLPIGQLGY